MWVFFIHLCISWSWIKKLLLSFQLGLKWGISLRKTSASLQWHLLFAFEGLPGINRRHSFSRRPQLSQMLCPHFHSHQSTPLEKSFVRYQKSFLLCVTCEKRMMKNKSWVVLHVLHVPPLHYSMKIWTEFKHLCQYKLKCVTVWLNILTVNVVLC